MTADAFADGPEPEDDETEQPPVHARLGEYRLVQRLGEGGMGVVHLALDRHGRAVAIKVLRQHIAHDPDARARLTREVRTLSRITSPRVAPIIDADVEGSTPYIVTRYVPGPSLDDYVAERGLLPPTDLHRVASGLAEALDAIHSAGVVHRDVKPGNVLLVDGDPVLIDFGIAHVADDIRLTMTGLVMGTPGYLAPEVVGGDDVTAATDWWGWAATTAFAASGAPPFGTGPMSAVLARVSAGDPALEPYAHGAPVTEAIQVRRVRPVTQRLSVPPTAALPLPPPPQPPASRPPLGAVAGAGVAGAAGAALAGAGGTASGSAPYAVPTPAAAPAPPVAAPTSAPSPLPPPMVTSGRPAGLPGWEQARPVNRQVPPIAPQVRAYPPPPPPRGPVPPSEAGRGAPPPRPRPGGG